MCGFLSGGGGRQNARTCWMFAKRSGNSGRYFRVLKCAAEKSLSVEMEGRLWVFRAPRLASRNATGLERIAVPALGVHGVAFAVGGGTVERRTTLLEPTPVPRGIRYGARRCSRKSHTSRFRARARCRNDRTLRGSSRDVLR
jgi:hypothetical protein